MLGKIKKTILALLCLSMMITQSIQPVYAQNDEVSYTELADDDPVSTSTENDGEIKEDIEVAILNEDESQRDESSKTFIMSNKTTQKIFEIGKRR